MEDKLTVFLSHASVNSSVMKEIADYLEGLGYRCWYAPRDIAKGNNYLVDIVDAIDKVDAVILLHSKDVHESKYVYREIEYADQKDKLILPILLDDAPIAKQLVLIIRSMQMTLLADFPSIPSAVNVLHERMETYKLERKQDDVSTDWISAYGTPLVDSSSPNHSTSAFLVKEARLSKIKKGYVEVDGFAEWNKALHRNHVAVLQHEDRVGKFSTGIQLLLSQAVEQVVEVLPTVSMVDFIKMPFHHKTGYIIDKASILFFEGTSLAIWEEIQDQLQQAGSFLVVTTEDPVLPDWMAAHRIDPPANRVEILIKHAEPLELSSALIGKITPYLTQLLPYEIALMADKLAPVVHGHMAIEEMIGQLQSQVEERVNHWYHQNGQSLPFISQYVTLAILKDIPEKTFLDASERLQQHLQASWPYRKEAAFLTDSERLTILQATRLTKKMNSDIGYVHVDHIQMNHPDEAEAMLTQFIKQFRFALPALLQWFDEYISIAKKSDQDTTLDALTVISSKDLPTVRQELLQKWAKHEQTFYRWTAVKILTKLFKEGHYVQEIILLIHSWSSQRNNQALQWTATVALGSEIGVFLYPKSLASLRNAYLSNPKALRQTVRQSYVNLMQLGRLNHEYDEILLLHFQEWLKEEQEVGKEPFHFLHFLFSCLRGQYRGFIQRCTTYQLNRLLAPFFIEAFKYSKSKRLAEEFITIVIYEQPTKLAGLILTLLYHEQQAVRERVKGWLKIRMTSANNEPFRRLYEEMMDLRGG